MKASHGRRLMPAIFLILLTLCGGCAAVDRQNAVLVEAHQGLTAAQADPQVRENAALELQEAELAMAQADQASRRLTTDTPEIEHLAYLAQRKTAIAVETAELRLAEQAVARANAERSELLLAVRAAETRRAQDQARKESLIAEQDRQQAREQIEAERRTAEEALKAAREQAEEAHRATAAAAASAAALEQQLAELRACRTNRGLVVTMDDVLFASGSSELAAGAGTVIDRLVAFLNENPTRRVQIEGFTDNVGDSDYNLQLSIERAESVRDALSRAGVAPERILIEGYGKEFPVASNDTADGRRRNRRVEAIISDEKGDIPDRSR